MLTVRGGKGSPDLPLKTTFTGIFHESSSVVSFSNSSFDSSANKATDPRTKLSPPDTRNCLLRLTT